MRLYRVKNVIEAAPIAKVEAGRVVISLDGQAEGITVRQELLAGVKPGDYYCRTTNGFSYWFMPKAIFEKDYEAV